MTGDGAVRRVELRIEAGPTAPAGLCRLAATVVAPADLVSTGGPVVYVCGPGGGMSQGYFDLRAEPDEYSMAAHLAAAHGVISVLIDHPGVGKSDRPDDPMTLNPHVVAAIDAHAATAALEGLRSGTLVDGLAPLPNLFAVGGGHSMGGMLAVYTQAHHQPYEALALLGFAGGGLREHLVESELALADQPTAVHEQLVDLVTARFGRARASREAGPGPGAKSEEKAATGTSAFLLAVPIPDHAKAAIAKVASNLLTLCGLVSMIPGASRPELDSVAVPVFVGVGEFDITGDAHVIPQQFPNSRDITLFVLDGSGHNHNVAPTRYRLWDRLGVWLNQIAEQPKGPFVAAAAE